MDNSNYDEAGMGRSYECSFCKRGFTNAQALGGHMNIHRKEKAKSSKQSNIISHTTSFSSPFISDQDNNNNNNIDSSWCNSDQANYNHPFYFQLLNPNYPISTKPHACYQSDHLTNVVASNSESLGSNLSLQMGPRKSNFKDKVIIAKMNTMVEHEVLDLELRLGHDP